MVDDVAVVAAVDDDDAVAASRTKKWLWPYPRIPSAKIRRSEPTIAPTETGETATDRATTPLILIFCFELTNLTSKYATDNCLILTVGGGNQFCAAGDRVPLHVIAALEAFTVRGRHQGHGHAVSAAVTIRPRSGQDEDVFGLLLGFGRGRAPVEFGKGVISHAASPLRFGIGHDSDVLLEVAAVAVRESLRPVGK